MATTIQFRRGTSTQTASFTGAAGEVTVDTTNDSLIVHDGSTAGGFEIANESGANLGTDIISTAKIIDGAVTANKLAQSYGSAISNFTGRTSSSSTSWASLTSANITKASSHTKVLVMAQININYQNTQCCDIRFDRAGSQIAVVTGFVMTSGTSTWPLHLNQCYFYVDDTSSTGNLSYDLLIRANSNTNANYDVNEISGMSSQFMLLEIL